MNNTKRIGNFTQTYCGTQYWSPGSDCKNRDFLVEAFCNDKNKIKAYELLDIQTFNFHNFEIEHAKKLATSLKAVLPNIKCTCYNNISFGRCIFEHMIFLKQQGMTDFLWVQDDEFFTHSNFEDFEKLFRFYKETSEIKNLSLLYSLEDTPGLKPTLSLSIPNSDIVLYKLFAQDILPHRSYPMDFTAFICNIDYFLTYLFEERFDQILDAYQLEGAVRFKSIQNNVERYFSNVNIFESFNIVGMGGSICQTGATMKKLKESFLK